MLIKAARNVISRTPFKPWGWMENEVAEYVAEDDTLRESIARALADEDTSLIEEWETISAMSRPTHIIEQQPTAPIRAGAISTYRLTVLEIVHDVLTQHLGVPPAYHHDIVGVMDENVRDDVASDIIRRAEQV